MRLVDLYIPAILYARNLVENIADSDIGVEEVHLQLEQHYLGGRHNATDAGIEHPVYDSGWFPVVAYIDELLLTSKWPQRRFWQKDSLQRKYFNTTNAGSEFFERLNLLNKHGEDRTVREVFLLCMGLGFKGKYYYPGDRPKLEAVREFNMGLLLPDEAQKNLEQSVLFRGAFSKEQLAHREQKKRLSLIPFLVGFPIVVIGGSFVYYAVQIRTVLNELVKLVS